MRNETGTEAIFFKYNPSKSLDVSHMGYCAFGLLKRTLFKPHPKILDELSKIAKGEWNKINLDVLKNSLSSRVGLGCRIKANNPLVGLGSVERVPSMGVFLSDSSTYLSEFRRK